MEKTVQLQNPEWFELAVNGRRHYGFNQFWYHKRVQKNAGCGPTAASMLLYYLNKKNPCIASYQGGNKEESVKIMEDVWRFVTPGFMGLNSTEKFKKGMEELFEFYHLNWKCHTLRIKTRQPYHPVEEFLQEALEKDSPVAFLNLHRGNVTMFDSWHWIVLIGLDKTGLVTACDDGKRLQFDLEHWINSTKMGGGLAYITGADNS